MNNKPLPKLRKLPGDTLKKPKSDILPKMGREHDTPTKKFKSGMYGEMPIIQIGRFQISMMSDQENEDRIWVRDGEEEGGEFRAKTLEPYVEEFFNKHF